MSELVIKKKVTAASSGWKPVCIRAELHEQLKPVAEEVGLSMGELTSRMLAFAVEHLVIVDDEDKAADKKGA